MKENKTTHQDIRALCGCDLNVEQLFEFKYSIPDFLFCFWHFNTNPMTSQILFLICAFMVCNYIYFSFSISSTVAFNTMFSYLNKAFLSVIFNITIFIGIVFLFLFNLSIVFSNNSHFFISGSISRGSLSCCMTLSEWMFS